MKTRTNMKKQAIKCKRCGSTVFSRARHDFRWCSCNLVAIDGGNNYTRTAGDPENFKSIQLDIEQTKKELYDDWNTNADKYGLIKGKYVSCPQCGGTGEYFSEMMARYDDHGVKCNRCDGKGIVKDWNKDG